jgi:ferrochelatase
MTLRHKGFDAVLVVSFGGPQGMDDIRPFLANVLRGRRVSPERLEEVVHHYELFGGVSPITGITLAQAHGLAERLRRHGPSLPVYVGMRNWHPFLEDTLAQMSRDGVRRAVGFITAGHKTYSSCGQYKVNVMEARQALAAKGLADVDVRFVGDWYDREGFVMANAVRVAEAIRALPEALRGEARVVFTMPTINQLVRKGRHRDAEGRWKTRLARAPRECPQKRGVCVRVRHRTPRPRRSPTRRSARWRASASPTAWR